MSREVHVPFYERLGVQFPRPTHRFCLSLRDTEDLLAQRDVTVFYEERGRSAWSGTNALSSST